MELQWSRLVMCSVGISGDGSGRTLQCCWWITPSSSQPLSLTTSALQHSCCPACSIADTGVTALPVCHAHCVAGWGTRSRCSLLSFCKGWAKSVKQKCEHLQTFAGLELQPWAWSSSCASVILLEISKIAESLQSCHNLRNHFYRLKPVPKL